MLWMGPSEGQAFSPKLLGAPGVYWCPSGRCDQVLGGHLVPLSSHTGLGWAGRKFISDRQGPSPQGRTLSRQTPRHIPCPSTPIHPSLLPAIPPWSLPKCNVRCVTGWSVTACNACLPPIQSNPIQSILHPPISASEDPELCLTCKQSHPSVCHALPPGVRISANSRASEARPQNFRGKGCRGKAGRRGPGEPGERRSVGRGMRPG